jgi:hypothetical protein
VILWYYQNERGNGRMKQKDGFQRLTIDQMKALKAEKEIQNAVNEAMSNLEESIEKEAEKLAQELVDSGYDIDDFEIVIDTVVDDGKLVAHLKVVQEGKTLIFDLQEH